MCFLYIWSKFGDPGLNRSQVVVRTNSGLTHGRAEGHTDKKTQATTIPEGQNKFQLKTVGCNDSLLFHYADVIVIEMASQITSLAIVYSIVYSDADQRKHQSSASLAFVQGIHRGPVNSPHKWPVTRKMLPFDDVIMLISTAVELNVHWS